ncbi:RNA-dependent RNA polymerase [Silvergrass cryptic virus 1]|nr:RNA-dependent RNA polymerase [Silvergrass cryptic virus 1]
MDHSFRGIRQGLIELKKISERRSRDEFRVYQDEYAAEAIRLIVPMNIRFELQGWARSYYDLQQHVQAIEAYNLPKLPEPTHIAWNQTKQMTQAIFRQFDQIDCLSYKDFDSVKWMSSSSAGYGYEGHKGDDDNYKKAKKTAVTIAEKLNHDVNYGPEAIKESTPDIAFTRTQLSQVKVKTKVRNVWGEAFHYVLLEGLFAQPIVEYFMNINSFYFIGKDPLLSVPALIDEMLRNKDYVYMFDWSAFDATVQEWEIRFAFECLESMIQFPSTVEFQIWRFVIELFIYRKIASPHGVLYLKTQGIPSGSCFTNIIGSITNYVRIQYMFNRLTGSFATVYTHGDDSLAAVNSDQFVHFNALEKIASEHLWKLNASKSSMSMKQEGVTFLSRTVREGQNRREELACLRMLMYPEYPVESGDLSALRAFSIMNDSGLHSSYFLKIFQLLKENHGIAASLPNHLKIWDPKEYEARKVSYSMYVM